MPEKLDFITPTFLKVIYAFHENPMREMHEREIVRKARISKGSANLILRKLSSLDILERNRRGKMVFYRFNFKDPVAKQFKVLLNVYSLHDLVKRLGSNCKKIILFGSCAEGTDVWESDIDLFTLATDKRKVREEISKYRKKLRRRLAPIVVGANELIVLKKGDKPLYDRISKGIILWESE